MARQRAGFDPGAGHRDVERERLPLRIGAQAEREPRAGRQAEQATAAATSRTGVLAPRAAIGPAPGARGGSSGALSTIRASPASRSRCFGSHSRQRRSSSRTRAGVAGGSVVRSGSRVTTRPSVSTTVSAAKSGRPTSIS
jgi:hypothetical protein